MAKKKKDLINSEDDNVLNMEVVAPEVVEVKKKVNAPKTKLYKLDKDVPIGDKMYKKGDSYPLTVNGAKYFKSKNYIK